MPLFPPINTENKLRLTLTLFAMQTLQEDARDFDLPVATLLNRILQYFAPEAEASLSLRLLHYEQEVRAVLGEDQEEAVQALVRAKEQKLRESLPRYGEKPASILFRVNNANLFFLTQDRTSREDLFYRKGLKAYAEALTEEFCRLPFLQRERIYCSEVCRALEAAMQAGHAVYLFHTFGSSFLLRIFDIVTDPLSTYHYVIARQIDPAGGKRNGRTLTFRLSRIARVTEKPDIPGTFTEEEKKKTAQAVRETGAQFLNDRVSRVVVEFTDAGLKSFASQLHLRPRVAKIREDGHTYEFACTASQAMFYFRRLGAEAKVLRPAFVRKEMAKWYESAAEAYAALRDRPGR